MQGGTSTKEKALWPKHQLCWVHFLTAAIAWLQSEICLKGHKTNKDKIYLFVVNLNAIPGTWTPEEFASINFVKFEFEYW